MPRAGLSPERVVTKGADVADELGYAQLTLAEVATRFGVRLPSLYKHVEGLEGLRRGVTLLALRELASELGRAAVGKSSTDALHALSDTYRAYALRHPGRYAATLRAPDPGDAEHQAAAEAILDVVFAVLAGYGLTDTDLVDATRALRSTLHGFASLEAAGGFGMPQDVDRSFQLLVDGLDAALSSWQRFAKGRRGDR